MDKPRNDRSRRADSKGTPPGSEAQRSGRGSASALKRLRQLERDYEWLQPLEQEPPRDK